LTYPEEYTGVGLVPALPLLAVPEQLQLQPLHRHTVKENPHQRP